MTTKTALITGGTSGIGLQIIKELAAMDYNVFFIGSNQQKGKEIEATLQPTAKGKITFIQLDLSDLTAVSQFVKEFPKQTNHLDLLANIAGVILPKRQETKHGTERTFTIGYLSPFILCNGLIPLLEKSTNARIVNVGGRPSWIMKSKINFEDLNLTHSYKGPKAALTTIHAKTVLTQILSEKLAPKKIDVNSFHPGMVRSNLTRNMVFPIRVLVQALGPLMPATSKNAMYVCTASELNGVTGRFFDGKEGIVLAFEDAYKERLWKETEGILERILGG